MPDDEKIAEAAKPVDKPVEDTKPPEAVPEAVIVEPQKEINPLEARIESLEKQLRERDEKERIAAEKSKEVKHGEVQEDTTKPGRGDERNPVLQKAKGDEGDRGTTGGDDAKGIPQPVKRGSRFKFRAKKSK